jgi:TonB family protein
MAAQQSKVLRIGVIQGGKIVEERVIPARHPVTVGTSTKNTIIVPQSDLPASVTVFAWQSDRYQLSFEDGADGRIQGPQGAADFGALVSQGLAKREGRGYSVPIGEDQRGKVVLGEVTLLWQFVTPPPEAPKPVLPKEAKGNHFKSMDQLFVSLLALSFLFHGATMVALANTELPPPMKIDDVPDRFVELIMPDKQPAPRVEEKRAEETKVVEEKKPEENKPSDDKKGDKPPRSAAQVAHEKQVRQGQVDKMLASNPLLHLLQVKSDGPGGGALDKVLGDTVGGKSVADLVRESGGNLTVGNSGDVVGARKGGDKAGTASIGSLGTEQGRAVDLGPNRQREFKIDVVSEAPEVDSSDLEQGKVSGWVKGRMGGIKACYENALKRNPSLKGKVIISFTITPAGTVEDAKTAGGSLGSSEVTECILGVVRGWRMPFKPAGPVTVVYPFVFSAAQ